MQTNRLKAKLAAGEPAIGTFVRLGSISVEILGYTNWDYVILDMEHGVHTMEDVSNMIRAAKAAGITAIVRVPGPSPVNVMRALDAGADGVQIPQVTNITEVKLACDAARYHPLGNRGVCAYTAATGYSTTGFDKHIETSNKEAMVVLHIENVQSAEMIEEILDLGTVDVIFCGPWDLSQSLGIPGQTSHPKVTGLIDKVLAACKRRGVASGIFVAQPQQSGHWLKQGVTYLSCGVDVGYFKEIMIEKLAATRQEIQCFLKEEAGTQSRGKGK